MKVFGIIMKIVAALAAVAGAVYVIATYGDKIVAWAKRILGIDCCCDDCDGECCCDGECDCEECECEECECCEEVEEAEEAEEATEDTDFVE